MAKGLWLEGLPNPAAWKPANQLHISLYRARQNGKGTKDVFTKIRKATSGLKAGTVTGAKVILKEIGTPWDDQHMRQVL